MIRLELQILGRKVRGETPFSKHHTKGRGRESAWWLLEWPWPPIWGSADQFLISIVTLFPSPFILCSGRKSLCANHTEGAGSHAPALLFLKYVPRVAFLSKQTLWGFAIMCFSTFLTVHILNIKCRCSTMKLSSLLFLLQSFLFSA